MTSGRYILHPKTIPTLGVGKHSDGGGLYLYRLANGYSQWVFRFTWLGRRQEMGLGGYPDTPLSTARGSADAHRVVLQSGQNPKTVKDSAKKLAIDVAVKNDPNALERQRLRSIAPLAFEARKKGLKGDGKAGGWYGSLQNHVLPALGDKLVSEIDGNAVQKALKSIWHENPDVARKAITRLGACLNYARAMGIPVDRNAIADARELLGKQVHVAVPIPAMAWQDVPAFYAALDDGSTVHLALRLLILTGVRSAPLRFAQISQIKGNVWTIPGDGMKGKKGKTKDFRVPLSDEAVAVIEQATKPSRDGFLFPNERKGILGEAVMPRYTQSLGLDARPHGFRSSFRTWADTETTATFEVKEMALAHKVGNVVSQTYIHTDYLDERALLGQAWANFVVRKPAIVTQLFDRN